MLDFLYENIGGKIKTLAKWTFIVEGIGAIITALALIFTDEDLILAGLLTLICGPIVAWISSWILYAFGELVEDIHALRNKEGTTDEVKEKRKAEKEAKREAKELAQKKARAFTCPKCSNTVNHGDASCSSCGQQFDWSKM